MQIIYRDEVINVNQQQNKLCLITNNSQYT